MVATLSLESFLESTLPPGLAEGYAVSLSEGGQPFYQRSSSEGKTNGSFPVSIAVAINGADWIVKVEPEPATLATLKSPYPAALLVLGTLFSGMLGLSIHFSRKAVTRSLEADESNLKLMETHVELASARDAALESARLKSRFLVNMSHEIRTPMNGVIGMAELLSHTGLNRAQSDYLGTIRESADLLLGIINDILDSSKIESGKLIFENCGFRIHSLVESSLDVVAAAASAKDLELAGIVHAGVFPYQRGDPGRIRQVLTNILGNAVKFTEKGEVTLSVTPLSETSGKVSLKFEIRDTGIGISPENQLHIFDAFNQADGSNTRQYGGTGLGLTICRQIVEALDGSIRVTSQPGTGSVFSFRLDFEKQTPPPRCLSPAFRTDSVSSPPMTTLPTAKSSACNLPTSASALKTWRAERPRLKPSAEKTRGKTLSTSPSWTCGCPAWTASRSPGKLPQIPSSHPPAPSSSAPSATTLTRPN